MMCMDCAPNFYAAGRACKECQDHDLEFPNPWLFAPVIVIVIVVVALWLWRRRHTEPVEQVRSNSCFTEFKEQIQAQGPILLQHCRWAMSTLSFCVFHFSVSFYINFLFNLEKFFINSILVSKLQGQLWGVLAALRKTTTNASSFWEIPYIETLQFSLSSLKGALNLQCKFDAWP